MEEQQNPPPNLDEFIAGFNKAMQPVTDALMQLGQAIVDAVEDAFRNNAFRPTGPVVRSTAIPVIDDDSKLLTPIAATFTPPNVCGMIQIGTIIPPSALRLHPRKGDHQDPDADRR